jgi:phosphoribosylformylglycinamidine cyclo-ligase
VLAEDAAALLDPTRWPVPAVMRYLSALGGLDPAEMRAIFNGGIGMVAVVEPRAAGPAIELLAARGVRAWHIGEVIAARGPERYEEGSLSGRAA